MDDATEGFAAQPDDVGDTGPSNLAKAAEDDGTPGAEQALTQLRFRRGYQRLWVDGSDSELIVFLYEFCDASGASGYRDRLAQRFEAQGGERLATDVAPATGFQITRGDAAAVVVQATDGPFAVTVLANGDLPGVTIPTLATRAKHLLDAQLKALPD